MRPTRLLASLLASISACALVPVALLGAPASGSASAAPASARGATARPSYVVGTLHFKVHVGPDDGTTCDIVGDVYRPRTATRRHPAPAVLTTNGFGGSKDDQAGIGRALASRGYVVLSYSGLGFGGSGCKITLDDPDWDGKAARQLVSYLGGARGIAFTDANHQHPAARLLAVRHDRRDHLGRHAAHDPRVGMVGGSYGGQIQFAAASVDPRIDTIVPMITWNDLSYSLAPNNTTLTTGVHSAVPGAVKLVWGLGFSGLGVADGLEQIQGDPSRVGPCPNFATFVCPALVTGGATGFFQPSTIAQMRHASVASYLRRIRIPTLLVQGENDTLFNLNEAVATYQRLRLQHTPVKMMWQSWGHSDLTPAPGEIDMAAPNPRTQYEAARVFAWFDHYLKGRTRARTGPAFSFFRPWVPYRGSAKPAYAAAPAFPVGRRVTWHLSGRNHLAGGRTVAPGSQTFLTPPAGVPTSLDPTDAVAAFFSGGLALPQQTLPGTSATWTSAPLGRSLDAVGLPYARLKVNAVGAGLTQGVGPAGKLVLFLKVVDVAPGGSSTMIDGEIAPVRIAKVGSPFTVRLPAIVHRFARGHGVGLVVAAGSQNYRGNDTPSDVTIAAGLGQTLSLPRV